MKLHPAVSAVHSIGMLHCPIGLLAGLSPTEAGSPCGVLGMRRIRKQSGGPFCEKSGGGDGPETQPSLPWPQSAAAPSMRSARPLSDTSGGHSRRARRAGGTGLRAPALQLREGAAGRRLSPAGLCSVVVSPAAPSPDARNALHRRSAPRRSLRPHCAARRRIPAPKCLRGSARAPDGTARPPRGRARRSRP